MSHITTFTISEEHEQQFIDATIWLFPIPYTTNMDYDPNNPSTGGPRIYEFTEDEWIKEAWRRHMVAQVARYKTYIVQKTSIVPADDSVVS